MYQAHLLDMLHCLNLVSANWETFINIGEKSKEKKKSMKNTPQF